MQASFAAPNGVHNRAARWQDAAWRALNITLSTMIGGLLGGSDGLAIGFAFGLCLILAPDGARFLLGQRPRIANAALTLGAGLWRTLPSSVRARIEERRRS